MRASQTLDIKERGYREIPWGRICVVLSSLLLLTVIMVVTSGVSGCRDSILKKAPKEILGTWESADPRYNGVTMEVTRYRLVFGNPKTGLTRNYIVEIKKFPEENRTLFEITHMNEDGLDYHLGLYYSRSGGEDTLRLKNREEIKWTRVQVPGL